MSSYVFDPAFEGELARIRGLEAIWDPGTQRILSSLGIGPGVRCLEVGGGGGSIARWMAEQIGPTGSVTVTDVDTRFLDPADGLTVLQHDVVNDDIEGEYDLIHSRLLLEHLPARESVLKKLVAALRPGGRLLIEDYDYQPAFDLDEEAFIVIPPSDAGLMQRTVRAVLTLMTGVGYDASFARTLPATFTSMGLTDVGCDVRSHLVRGGSPGSAFFSWTVEALGPRLVELGLVSEDDIKRSLATFSDPATAALSPPMVATWGSS